MSSINQAEIDLLKDCPTCGPIADLLAKKKAAADKAEVERAAEQAKADAAFAELETLLAAPGVTEDFIDLRQLRQIKARPHWCSTIRKILKREGVTQERKETVIKLFLRGELDARELPL